MKKRIISIMIGGAVLLLLADALAIAVYTRPMSLEQLYPGVSLSDCRSIRTCSESAAQSGAEQEIRAVFRQGSPEFEALMVQFQNRRFHRSLYNWLPESVPDRPDWKKEFEWSLCFETGDVSGEEAALHNNYGVLEYTSEAGKTILCKTHEQGSWLEEIMAILSGTD